MWPNRDSVAQYAAARRHRNRVVSTLARDLARQFYAHLRAGMRSMASSMRRRRELAQLLADNGRIARDIGLTSTEIASALDQPWWMSVSRDLHAAAVRRRDEAIAVAQERHAAALLAAEVRHDDVVEPVRKAA